MRTDILLTILGMAVATYATRAGGLWLMARVPPAPLVERWLGQIPGAVLVSIVAPAVFLSGASGWAASAATILIAARTGNLLLAIVAGVVVIWALQSML